MRARLRYFRRIHGRTARQRKSRDLFIADTFEIDIPELQSYEISLASSATDAAFENPPHIGMRETYWHDERHWGFIKEDQKRGTDAIVMSWAAQECLNKRLYDSIILSEFIHGRMLAPTDKLLDVSEDYSDQDFIDAVNAAQDMLRIVGGRIMSACNEPLIAIRCDNRPKKGQDQGFKAWMPVETVLASPAGLPNDRMYFRYDQVELLRELAGDAELRELDQAARAVQFALPDSHVQDVWSVSARGYLERRLKSFRSEP